MKGALVISEILLNPMDLDETMYQNIYIFELPLHNHQDFIDYIKSYDGVTKFEVVQAEI